MGRNGDIGEWQCLAAQGVGQDSTLGSLDIWPFQW